MFIELAEVLRCPNAHEESWLVLAPDRIEGRDAMEGTLGCPVCRAEFAVRGGVAEFAGPPRLTRRSPADPEDAVRLAALLDLTDSRGYGILLGDIGGLGEALRDLTDVQLLLVNPPRGVEMGAGLSGLTLADGWSALPLAAGTARALAVDHATTLAQLESALAVVKTGGRIVAPIGLRVPENVTELARDDRHWVWERTRATVSSGVISIERRGRGTGSNA